MKDLLLFRGRFLGSGFLRSLGFCGFLHAGFAFFHFGFLDKPIFTKVVQESLFTSNKFGAHFFLLPGLVRLHRVLPDVAVFTEVVKVSLFTVYLYLSDFDFFSHYFSFLTDSSKGILANNDCSLAYITLPLENAKKCLENLKRYGQDLISCKNTLLLFAMQKA